MSMIGALRRISADLHERILRDPAVLSSAVLQRRGRHGPVSEVYAAALERMRNIPMPPEQRANLEAGMLRTRQLFEAQGMSMPGSPRTGVAVEPPTGLGPVVSLEKMWQALHFLVTGSASKVGHGKASFVLGGKECVGSRPTGYGPPRLLSPAEVAVIAAELHAEEELHSRFDPKKLSAAGIYPNVWDEDPEELWDELGSYYEQVRTLYQDAAAAGDAMVLWIS